MRAIFHTTICLAKMQHIKFNFHLLFQYSFILLTACTTFLTLSDIIKLIQISIRIVIMSNIFNGTTRLFFLFINLVTTVALLKYRALNSKIFNSMVWFRRFFQKKKKSFLHVNGIEIRGSCDHFNLQI